MIDDAMKTFLLVYALRFLIELKIMIFFVDIFTNKKMQVNWCISNLRHILSLKSKPPYFKPFYTKMLFFAVLKNVFIDLSSILHNSFSSQISKKMWPHDYHYNFLKFFSKPHNVNTCK